MGALYRFQLSPGLIARFPIFIETGTGLGTSLAYAAEHNFRKLYSIEIDDRLYQRAKARFAGDERIEIIKGSSPEVLAELLPTIDIKVGILFWLDAHFPGSDFFGKAYDSEADLRKRLPLEWEFETITKTRVGENIALIVDDARVYTDCECENGRLPASHRVPKTYVFAGTFVTWPQDDGYLVHAPQGVLIEPIRQMGIRELADIADRNIQSGDLFTAGGFYRRILDLTADMAPPGYAVKAVARGEACHFFGLQALNDGREGTAMDWLREATTCNPLETEYRLDLIYKVLIPARMLDLALEHAEVGVRITPDLPRPWIALAMVEREMGNAEGMELALDKAAGLAPDDPDVLRALAIFFADTGYFDEADAVYDELRAHSKLEARDVVRYLTGKANVASRRGWHEQALELVTDALACEGITDDARAMAEWHRSEILLTMGRYAEGWKGQAKRFDLERLIPGVGPAGSRFKAPMWERDMPPQRVLVHAEQGAGDIFCMARYLQRLVYLGHDVRFEVPDDMVSLLAHSFPDVKVVKRALNFPGILGLEAFDSHIPSMCLPALFETTLDTIPWPGPYISAEPVGYTRIGEKARIGLCWKSGARPGLWHAEYARRKSMSFDTMQSALRQLRSDRIVVMVSLVPGQPATPMPRVALDASWADTASLIASCDAVVTVDTGVAHLAGAMGKPVYLAKGFVDSWHWMCAAPGKPWHGASPWYPSVKVYRAEEAHEWDRVMRDIATELKEDLFG